jgi:hypothetical protein
MANRGWDNSQGGSGWPSNARTTGRTSGTGDAQSRVQGSKIADPGNHSDPLDEVSDRFEPPGQLSTC